MDPRKPTSVGRRPGSSATRSKYAARACQECRRRRSKCDGEKPSCSRCLARGKECVFTDDADNRGSAPKSYVNLLQARIKLLEQVLWLHSVDVDASIAKLESQREVVDAAAAPAYSSSIAFNEACAELEGALYLDEPLCENEAAESEASFFGATSGRLELHPSPGAAAGSPDMEPSPSTVYQSPVAARHSGHAISTEGLSPKTEVDDLLSPELRDHLIDLYFEWEQPWCQMVDEKLFRQSLSSNGPYASTLLLCSILAIGSRYSDRVEARSDPKDSRTAGRVFAERADELLVTQLRSPKITTIQALGVLGIYHVGVGSDSLGWLYHGMANRLLLDIGLNLDSAVVTGTGGLASEEVQLRRQIYWALYCNDKLWASYSGRICTMLDSMAAVPLPSPPPPGKIPGNNKSYGLVMFQRALAALCQILEKILTSFYAPKRLSSVSEKRAFFDSCILTLRGWFYSLPKELKIRSIEGISPLPHVFILSMVYNTSVVLLVKPFLRQSGGGQTEAGMQYDHDDVKRRAGAACQEAVKDIYLLAEKYRELYGSFRRSPLTATHCTLTAALVVMSVQDVADGKTASARDAQLHSYLRTLRELSVSWGPPLRYWRTLNRMLRSESRLAIQKQKREEAGLESPEVGAASAETREEEVNLDTRMKRCEAADPACGQGHAAKGTPGASFFGQEVAGAEMPDASIASIASIAISGEPWSDNAGQVFTEIRYFDMAAFDAASWNDWEHTDQDALNDQFWGPGNTWQ